MDARALPDAGAPAEDLGARLDASTPGSLVIVTARLPAGMEEAPYRAELIAAGGSERGYRWSSSGRLPDGIILRSSGTPNTVLEGSPRETGTFALTIRVQDDLGGLAERAFEIEVRGRSRLTVPRQALPEGCSDEPYRALVRADGASGEVAWQVRAGQLPPGLALRQSAEAVVEMSGVPSRPGVFSFSLRAEDDAGARAEQRFGVEIFDCTPPLEILVASPGPARIGVPYDTTLSARGGRGPYEWSVLSGRLPPGLTLDPMGTPDTRIRGTPREAGAFSFRVEATDAAGNRAREAFFLEVRP
jgi:hypothetical protein